MTNLINDLSIKAKESVNDFVERTAKQFGSIYYARLIECQKNWELNQFKTKDRRFLDSHGRMLQSSSNHPRFNDNEKIIIKKISETLIELRRKHDLKSPYDDIIGVDFEWLLKN